MTADSFTHGWNACRACHNAGDDLRVDGDWHIRANPGYWGASEPEVLVLGFSKGANQTTRAPEEFDRIAFNGIRERLQDVLATLGVDLGGSTLDQALSAVTGGGPIGAASLVRCGLSMMDKGKLTTSGTIMPAALRSPVIRTVMAQCMHSHLASLPPSVKLVVLLGTSDGYIKGVMRLARDQFADFRRLDDASFMADGRPWVFATHPSRLNGHFNSWMTGDSSTTAGRKRDLAVKRSREALCEA
ncbi:MAG: hypothetical protein ACRER5_03045 [Pseudomonas sp.]